MRVYQGVNSPTCGAADKSDDLHHIVPGIMCAFAELDDKLAPPGNGLDLRQWLDIELTDEIKQHPVFGADTGEFHTLITKTAQEQRARCVQAVEFGNV